ncbi:MAG: glycosyltransferase [Candidatus Tectomicrobia bacterium]|uniref:Glycosyltransferase n=1 Tax=Tectimicrobiota bacterium TaxID=2528274 RepID=A0A933GK59_UNCTE|nr:glycosyltransferase [Candidatus Tectomicrobia bacterium]
MPFEILVIDQTEDQKQKEEVKILVSKFSKVKYFHLSTKGSAQAKNFGIRTSLGKIICFLDDDCLALPNWLGIASKHFLNYRYPICLLGRIKLGGELLLKGDYRLWDENNERLFLGKVDPWIFKATGANIFMPRVIFDKVGLFDERFGPGSPWRSGEDADLLYRISLTRIPIAYAPSVAIIHRDWRDFKAEYQNLYDYGLGVGGLLGKYLMVGDLFFSRTVALRFSRKFIRLLWGLLSLNQPMALEGYYWSAGIMAGFMRYLYRCKL